MRIRTIMALATGVVVGAAGSRLLDPETGQQARRDALQQAIDRGREVDWAQVLTRAGEVAQELGERAAEGYRDGIEQPTR